ncbi:MAG TPA: hypothetical protein VJG83_04255 [archaeon]|nr:hypothetical protein [archaeon]
MPLFGKGRKNKSRVVERQITGRRFLGKKIWNPKTDWAKHSTELSWIKGTFGKFWRTNSGENFIYSRYHELKRPQLVLDWGCARGVAATELALEGGPRVQVIGYSKDSYSQWTKNDEVTFIQCHQKELGKYLKKFPQIDLIYSHFGLWHLTGGWPTSKLKPDSAEHFKALFSKLSDGGRIVFNGKIFNLTLCKQLAQLLGNSARVEVDRWENVICITKLS